MGLRLGLGLGLELGLGLGVWLGLGFVSKQLRCRQVPGGAQPREARPVSCRATKTVLKAFSKLAFQC